MLVKQNCWIGCPWFKKKVAGYYETDSLGRYLVDQRKKYIIERTHCFNENNRCPYSQCVLHRSGGGNRMPTRVFPFPNR